MKSSLNRWHILPFSLFLALAACNNQASDQSSSTKDTATSNADTSGMAQNNSSDQQFVKDMVAGNIGEIKLAQLAEEKAATKDVKDLGKMLVKDHTSVLDELKSYASKKNIDVPTEEAQDAKDAYNDFSKKSGKDFDKDWCDLMETKHKAGITKFEEVANDNNADPELKSIVNKTLPTLRSHLDHVMMCKDKLK
jgi:putative membrane protein